jgi:hypothetical protein
LVAFFLLLAASAQADTIYMKNGSVIRGTVVDYADGRFTVMLNLGGSGAQSRATLVGSEIDRIEFEAPAPAGRTRPRGTSRQLPSLTLSRRPAIPATPRPISRRR